MLRGVRLAQSSRIDGLPLPTLLRSAPAPAQCWIVRFAAKIDAHHIAFAG
jgi:hypothetical protein